MTMDASRYDEIDPSFKDDLEAGYVVQKIMAHWLRARNPGKEVVVPEKRVRDKPENMRDYRDGGDVYMEGRRFEVKRRGVWFRTIEDFAKKFDTIIVDVRHCWDEADPKPQCYFLCNPDVSNMIVVPASSHERWVSTERWDQQKGRVRRFWECPIDDHSLRHFELWGEVEKPRELFDELWGVKKGEA